MKTIKKLPKKVRSAFRERLSKLLENPSDTILGIHKLHGEYEGCFSINVTGDVRAIFEAEVSVVRFINIGTHSQLYK